MRKLRALWRRLLHARHADAEFAAELEGHVEMHVEDGVRAGLSPDEARRQAHLHLGGVEQARQAYRERATLPVVETVRQDVRYALRGFARNSAFTLTAVLTLTLGIGASAAVFSVVDRILFRSLPYAQDDRLVSVGLVQPLQKTEFTLGGFFFQWRDQQKPFQSLTYERGVRDCDLTEGNPVHLQCAAVAQNFLSTLGVMPQLGRNFLPEEDAPNGPRSALLTDALWLSRFNRDPGVLGKWIDIDDQQYRIIGVLPKDFEMPRLQALDVMLAAQVNIAEQHKENSGIGVPLFAFARLKPGVSIAEAKAEMEPLFETTRDWIPPEIRSGFRFQVRSIRDRQMADAYTAARILLGAVIVVLLIACANVASLLSARGVARQREMAVRSALGASRVRLIRQVMTEAVLLAAAGALLGIALAMLLVRTFVHMAPAGIPFLANASVDLRVIGFTVLLALCCTLVFGIVPALEKPRQGALGARAALSPSNARLRRTMVAFQIAASMILLTGASLLLQSFRNLQDQNLGMQTRNVLTVKLPIPWQRYPTNQGYMDLYLHIEDALRKVPGITAVGISDSVPPDATSWHNGRGLEDIYINGKAAAPARTTGTVIDRIVTPDYFRVLQIPILEGRNFTDNERRTGEHALILSKLLAARLFPSTNPIGHHIRFADFSPTFVLGKDVFTVVGVAANVKNGGLAGQDDPEYYELRTNNPNVWSRHTILVLESELPITTVAPWIRAQINHVDPKAPVEITSLSQSVNRLADRPRFEAALITFFALTGLLMAVIGLYGVLAFMAAQRTQEIGVRMALGATRADILRLISAESVRLIVIGGAVGLAISLASAQVIRSMLFQVGPRDPVSLVVVTLLLVVVSFVATVAPARAAMKTNPMEALRAD